MRSPLRLALLAVCIAWIAALTSAGPFGLVGQAQQETTTAVWLELVNETRLDEGLNPYSRSRLLSAAAQRHADDIAENGLADADNVYQGSDGTDAEERIQEAGYAAWTEDGDQMVVAENVWSGRGTPEDAFLSFMEDQNSREDLLSDTYREIGIGAATDTEGTSVYVLDVGARPNVLPVFINDGAASTENREVAIRLTNERVRPEGEGASFMGEAIEVRISNQPSFEGLAWQSWAPLVSWTLPETAGEHTVYVEFRDAAGRTAASADSIVLSQGTPASPTSASPTDTPTSPPTDTDLPSGPTSESTIASGSPESESEPTTTPEIPRPEPSSTSRPVLRATPFPTWTPLPSPQPTRTDLDEVAEPTFSLPDIGDYRRPLAIVGILQGVVIVLGGYWLLRHGRRM
jgi:uncharacterized protein YkwD